jgi:hypothetical protein
MTGKDIRWNKGLDPGKGEHYKSGKDVHCWNRSK